jgi:hypothetical protein
MCVEVLVVPFALYHVRCTICAVPFALYHLRRIMRVVSCGAVELTRAGARARDGQFTATSSQSFGGQAVTCYVFLSSLRLRAVQFPQLWIVVFVDANAATQRIARPKTRNRTAQVRVGRCLSPRVPSRHLTSWRFGSVRRPSRMGAGIGRSASGFGRARARGRVGAAAASGEARRARASNH